MTEKQRLTQPREAACPTGVFHFPKRHRGLIAAVVVGMGWLVLVGTQPEGEPAALTPAALTMVQQQQDEEVQTFGFTADELFLMPDRTDLQRMRAAEEMIKQGQYNSAVRLLDLVLESDADYFVRHEGGESFSSFKQLVEHLIGDLPEAGLAAYEDLYGAQAARLLSEAVAAGELKGLMQCASRYFHTKAGRQAAWLLGQAYLDRGQLMTATSVLERLKRSPAGEEFEPDLSLALSIIYQRSGRESDMSRTLKQMREQHPNARFNLGGRDVPIFADELRAEEWLAAAVGTSAANRPLSVLAQSSWLLPQGNASGTPIVQADRPVSIPNWSIPISDDPRALQKIDRLKIEFETQTPPVVAIPGGTPLTAGDFLILRTIDSIFAVDFATGRRVYPIAVDPFLQDDEEESLFADTSSQMLELERRLVEDLNSGMMSSDESSVYYVTLRDPRAAAREQFLGAGTSGEEFAQTNQLHARDLNADGKLLWTLGGPSTSGNPLAGAYFLGPPLPLDGVLYCLVKWEGAVQLTAIGTGQTGGVQLLWKQPLAALDAMSSAYGRLSASTRPTGVTPSFSDGALICPTGAGAIVAIDIVNKSLRWGFKYEQTAIAAMLRAQNYGYSGRRGLAFDRWMSATAKIQDGRVFLTPIYSDRIYCLDLLTGEKLWDAPRGDGLYLATVSADTAFVTCVSGVQPLNLEDGTPAVSGRISFPEGVHPSGQGIRTPGEYLLPLSNGQLAKIDLPTATMVDRINLQGMPGQQPRPLGNLISYRGTIISQSIESIDCFFQLDYLERASAAEDSSNAEAITSRAIVHLERGERDQAIGLLERSLSMRQDELTRLLLVNHLRAILREDFAGNRNLREQIAGLLETDTERADFLNDVAEGLYTTGEYLASFEVYLDLAALRARSGDADGDAQRRVDSEWLVREDCYLGGQLMNLYAIADSGDRARMAELIDGLRPAISPEQIQSMDRSQLARSAAELRQFVNTYRGHALANDARIDLAQIIRALDPVNVETELLLRQTYRLGDAQQKLKAVVELTDLSLQLKDFALAGLLRDRLEQATAADESPDDLIEKANALIARLDQSVSPESKQPAWGAWNRQAPERGASFPVEQAVPLAIRNSGGADQLPTVPQQVLWDERASTIYHQTPGGATAWKLGIDPLLTANRQIPTASTRFHQLGNLNLVVLGDYLAAVSSTGGNPKLVREMSFSTSMQRANADIRTRSLRKDWGEERFFFSDEQNRPLGEMVLLSEDCLCLLQGNEVIAVNPAQPSGILWRRRLPSTLSMLFGSDDRVFAVDFGKVYVLRATDGALLGEREFPSEMDVMGAVGEQIVTWRIANQVELKLEDCWTGTLDNPVVHWQREFDLGAMASPFSEQQLAVLEPSGRFSLVDLKTGELDMQIQLQPEKSLSALFVVKSGEQLLVVANSSENFETRRTMLFQIPQGTNVCIEVNGWVSAIDLSTKEKLWDRKIGEHGLWLTQPAGLPVVAFVCAAHIREGTQQQRVNSVMILDKRTGEIIHQDESAVAAATSYRISADPENGGPENYAVHFDLYDESRLSFGFEPPPARQPD